MGRRKPECCPGASEPFTGDPRGLHNLDCPVYLDNCTALEQIFHAGKRREPDPLGLRSERIRALAGPLLAGRAVRDAADVELDAERAWLRGRLAAVDGGVARRDRDNQKGTPLDGRESRAQIPDPSPGQPHVPLLRSDATRGEADGGPRRPRSARRVG